MRAIPSLLTAAAAVAALLLSCRPSAKVEHTTPVANLQSYATVGLRVKSTAFGRQGLAPYLEQATLGYLRQRCGFTAVGTVGSGPPTDVVLDLNITSSGRGGGGWIQNSSTATIDTLLVLSDGQSGELLGSSRIRGKSSGMIVNDRPPENEALEEIAKTVADVLAKSGCAGPRVARAEPPVPDKPPPGTGSGSGSGSAPGPGSAGPPPVDDAKRAQAEQLNEKGKEQLRSADVQGALVSFQQAVALVADARYQYNICLSLEALEQWANAIAACKQARGMNPEARLVAKIDHRLDLLKAHQ